MGKTTFLQLTARRLADDGWTVFEASGADIMAGQQWFGQLEGRIRETVDQLTVGKKVVWYIPDLLQLARSGTHQGQSASILDQILPAIVAGRLIVWTEATRTSVARLMQIRPALRGIFDVVEIEPRSEEADADARARGGAAALRRDGIHDRAGLRRRRGHLRAAISERRQPAGLGDPALEACSRALRARDHRAA